MNYLAWGFSGGELLIVLAIILVLFGGKRIPEFFHSLGKAKGEFQKGLREVNEELEKAAKEEPPTSKASKTPSETPSENSIKKN